MPRVDGWTGFQAGPAQCRPRMRVAGIEVLESLPVHFLRRKSARFDLRNHRKIAVIDGQTAYVGSQNLVNRDFKPGIIYEELVARMMGPVVLQLQGIFLIDYFAETDQDLFKPEYFPPETAAGTTARPRPAAPGIRRRTCSGWWFRCCTPRRSAW